MCMPAVANLYPPTTYCMLHGMVGSMLVLQCQVRLFKLHHSLAPSRVRNPHAMRVRSVVGCARGPDGLAGYGCASPAAIVHQMFFASNKYVGL